MPIRKRNPYYQGPVSDHFDGRLFFTPEAETLKSFSDVMRWMRTRKKSDWPRRWPEAPHAAKPLARVEGDGLGITMIGHASLLIQIAGLNILTDPVFERRASPFSVAGPLRVNDPGIAFADLPPIDLVLLTHNHYDHMDIRTLKRLKKTHDPLVITPLGNDTILKRSIPDLRIGCVDWGETVAAGTSVIHCEPTCHWSARGVGDRAMALWCSFVIETPAGKIYHIGDTSFHEGRHYRMIREKHGDLRAAILPIGAYEPRWFMKTGHQNPEEAVAGFQLCGARFAVAHHWGTFQLTDEPIEAPRQALHEALSKAGVEADRFRTLLPGQSFNVPA
ncbi:MBL fold metallo-hydrolase [Rhizobium paknamense]|uniref:L-ascorbate metabolism protein UlaG (Beta-lactamase superfamily) n=1 Tax=Rhizobium paknamense TaxID=1206817 RepID=A0ABU0IC68_9HYPH|nr:MBL fold metallo-hydrolase [Rhizobium paknamense]MDQ0455834.1 L-ascorbate metabolism protein UlaG (beta-lactamase superfamily) [Rhizobium paknamense]